MTNRPRVIVALPDVAECATVAEWLAADGFEPVRRPSPRAAAEEMHARAFNLLVTDAAVAVRDGLLAASRGRSPMTPAVVIGDGAPAGSRDAVGGHAMRLDRPIDRRTLACILLMAMMDGRTPRRSARKVANRFEAVVNGVPSHLVDVSHEGLRLELPREKVWAPPPCFSVRVPLMGIAVTVQRVWVKSAPGQGRMPVLWCGAALSGNRPAAEQGWRAFVEMIPTVGETPSS